MLNDGVSDVDCTYHRYNLLPYFLCIPLKIASTSISLRDFSALAEQRHRCLDISQVFGEQELYISCKRQYKLNNVNTDRAKTPEFRSSTKSSVHITCVLSERISLQLEWDGIDAALYQPVPDVLHRSSVS